MLLTAFWTAAKAAPVHETERLAQNFVNQGWITELYQTTAETSVAYLAHEQFRSFPQGKTIPLDFGNAGKDRLDLPFRDQGTGIARFQYGWISQLFGQHSWIFGNDSNDISISVHSTSAIPLPAALPLFMGAFALFCAGLAFARRRKSC
ncbi:MAG: hypothetical protein CMN55_05950 [Sneathiella sp.]|uniref:hypothetical protein n=1 Tax=Sneathiella sp. TaxID=1964365 RepID=UPI000C5EFADE|nr:hypothetical protein [Sneathiella sp.]MAL78644.1 hypothetical protein [Sneathiella sp.]